MIEQDNKKCIVVIGDIMLDEYVYGTVSRVSPESCCPILNNQKTSVQLGGAANVAYQIRELGRNTMLVGIIGKDEAGETLKNELSRYSLDCQFVFEHNTVTTKKTRYVNDVHQQMFRVDKEEYNVLSTEEINQIISYFSNHAEDIDCIILSDYNKGVLTKDSCQAIINSAREVNIPTIVDIKVPDIDKYKNATLIKGNQKEFLAFFCSTEMEHVDLDSKIRTLKQNSNATYVVVTLGKAGIAGIDSKNNFIKHSSNQVMVYDVTGAGDVVTAYLGVLFKTRPFDKVLWLANRAAEIKVTKFGNSHVSFNEICPSGDKIKNAEEISILTKGKNVVFTNGCFDILHAGHIDLFQYAKTRGDVLVVGLNTDDSIKRLKGKDRPINSLEMRTKVLSAISEVDYIVCFDEDTPEKIIRIINPSVLIKGGDYTIDNIVGADYVQHYGGMVETVPFHFSTSTSKILSSL